MYIVYLPKFKAFCFKFLKDGGLNFSHTKENKLSFLFICILGVVEMTLSYKGGAHTKSSVVLDSFGSLFDRG